MLLNGPDRVNKYPAELTVFYEAAVTKSDGRAKDLRRVNFSADMQTVHERMMYFDETQPKVRSCSTAEISLPNAIWNRLAVPGVRGSKARERDPWKVADQIITHIGCSNPSRRGRA